MKNKKFMSLLLLLLGVGFAAVSTTLLMNGNVNIGTNNDDFDVIFTKAVLDGTDISSTAITDGGKTITFETKDLVNVGDISKLDFEVTNNSTMYDADVSIEYTVNEENKEYYEITKEVVSSIAARTIGSGKVEVKLLKASTENIQGTFTCTLRATAKERTGKANNIPINAEDFDVRFTQAKMDEKLYVTSTAISEDGKMITFDAGSSEYGRLSNVGDISTLDFEVTNNSTMYDAEVSIECDSVGPKSDYYKILTEIGSPVLSRKTRVGKIKVVLEKESIENVNGIVTCNLIANAKEKSIVEPLVRYTPEYFSYDEPTLESTKDYTTLTYPSYDGGGQAKIFAGLDADGSQKSVCIIRNDDILGEYLFCIKHNNFADSVDKLIDEFGEFNCGPGSYGSSVECYDDGFSCAAYAEGHVKCEDHIGRSKQVLTYSDGSIHHS